MRGLQVLYHGHPKPNGYTDRLGIKAAGRLLMVPAPHWLVRRVVRRMLGQ